MLCTRTQETAQKVLDALGLTGQYISSLRIDFEPDSLIVISVKAHPDAKHLDRFKEVAEAEFQRYYLTPIKTQEP
jgi:hypothetical protein